MAEKCPRVWQRSRTKLGQSALARLKVEKRNCPKTSGREMDFKMYFEYVVISQKNIEHIYLSTKTAHTKLDSKTSRRTFFRACVFTIFLGHAWNGFIFSVVFAMFFLVHVLFWCLKCCHLQWLPNVTIF